MFGPFVAGLLLIGGSQPPINFKSIEGSSYSAPNPECAPLVDQYSVEERFIRRLQNIEALEMQTLRGLEAIVADDNARVARYAEKLRLALAAVPRNDFQIAVARAQLEEAKNVLAKSQAEVNSQLSLIIVIHEDVVYHQKEAERIIKEIYAKDCEDELFK